MRRVLNKAKNVLHVPTIRLEGSLLLADQVDKAARGEAEFQTEADYLTPKGLKLRDDYSRAFQIASAQWKHFAGLLERTDRSSATVAHNFVQELLRDALGYRNLVDCDSFTIAGRQYPITLRAKDIPVVTAPHTSGLDEADSRYAVIGGGSRKLSPFQLAQEFLNASDDHMWALVSNGRQLRLLRDSDTLTRPSYLEFDLEDLLESERFAEFAMVWRLLHGSRAAHLPNKLAGTNVWEAWRAAGIEEGARVREGLREGVKQALLTLGNGFIVYPANQSLRSALDDGDVSSEEYFRQLLRMIYRFIFVFTIEERGYLHSPDDTAEAVAARGAYAEGYALSRLRDASLRRRARNRFTDVWERIRIVFRGLAHGESRLALPALGGLFAGDQCALLDELQLSNKDILQAIRELRWMKHDGGMLPVDYRNMGPEELGSVYESLLELVPEIDTQARSFTFIGDESDDSTAGNQRKLTGSYYTPDSLVQQLVKTALEPVIVARVKDSKNPVDEILNIKVIDPACGSGHFLLAAARRLAEHAAALSATDGVVKPEDYRHALREVIANCIFGVDRNPMGLELARMALWLEGFEEGRPLSFLNHHLQCGDALLGLVDLSKLRFGISKDAYKPLAGDDRTVCNDLKAKNRDGLRAFERERNNLQDGLKLETVPGLVELEALETMPQETTADVEARAAAYEEFLQTAKHSRLAKAADLLLGAFLMPKKKSTPDSVCTSETLFLEMYSDGQAGEHQVQHDQKVAQAAATCAEARVFHWPLMYPQVFAGGGFDCVLANPPWERIKLQEQEFFATRHMLIAEAKNKAERNQRLDWLGQGVLTANIYPDTDQSSGVSAAEKRLYREFEVAKRYAEAASAFMHVREQEGGRFPLTGKGDVNTYALFAETFMQINHPAGRAGFVVPTGIATDDSTKDYFGFIAQNSRLVSLYDFENKEPIFSEVHRSFKFSLVTLGAAEEAEFAFFLTNAAQLNDERRRFNLNRDDFERINPNTLTCPVFRSRKDAELSRKVYRSVPVLLSEATDERPEENPWGLSFMAMFHMSNDSHLFIGESRGDLLPLYEAKMIHQLDHRWATYVQENSHVEIVDVKPAQKAAPDFLVSPRYWVRSEDVKSKLVEKDWVKEWLIGFRDITNTTNERTVISTVVPVAGVGNNMPLIFPGAQHAGPLCAALVANLSSIPFDFFARHKVGGTHLNFFIAKQLPVLPPEAYSDADLDFLVSRILQLTYTAFDMRPWAEELGCRGDPFVFDIDKRAKLRAEIDAWYAYAYGLDRDDLRYILDPSDVMGADYPSETFRGLKKNEMSEFGEYRTQRLVLEAWDRLETGELE